MLLADFDYDLPQELIAQEASEKRDASRLMTIDRHSGEVGETLFSSIPGMFRQGDLLVVNNTRVIPARLFGHKESGGKVEVFLVRRLDQPGESWQAMLRCSKSPVPGTRILFSDGMTAVVTGRCEEECWQLSFEPQDLFSNWLECHGTVPLPPYIKRQADKADKERYQTVFAAASGAVAAPTAGLHFTEALLDQVRQSGVAVAALTLHVGLGTFLPVRCDDLSQHRMHRERYLIPQATADLISSTKRLGGRVIALGTTTARALEYAATECGTVKSGDGDADIFITPGYRFKVVDTLITNFHLPKSTLLMLVSAFAGKDLLFRAYREAVARRFRFYSYGDAMIIY
ncbi:tRNA preQ1(34) S-adenosylmethionine ribosyltransferase-isomerase QueA [Geobacter pelophilus]|uniref:S-adenosylmethionine:tRNA ribosyltransferase-isomerase n=1 Tax=Geoanaerobacter pelophilus TaxID=60036 RepID=A0AAW4L3E2_9BACT|nr:tRNA preQ1(34) S-adenosylmethionine ribosyltransferase-isomerase QueA [Geoanaerobacter pelophilus]MBT0665463.1 tRNA preQ1(34) S-adenosylmethionine ribosyltransferase-isomerase QueA [Geoanaerobacter pelophilus]